MRSNPYTSSFNAGEISPRLHARTDFGKYKSALATAENVISLPEGGLTRRSGSRYIAELKSSAVKGRLEFFKFTATLHYILEYGALAFRFYRDQAQILAADITGAITNGTFATDLASWTDLDTGGTAASIWVSAYMQLTGDGTFFAYREQTVASITNPSTISMQFRIIGAPGDEVILRIGTASQGTQIVNDRAFKVGYHVYTFTATATTIYIGFRHSANKALGVDNVAFLDGVALELETPYTEAQLFRIFGPQTADIAYLFHGSQPTYRLERYGHTTWSLIEVPWNDGPWLPLNESTTTLAPSAATVGLGRTVTASSVVGIITDFTGDRGFLSTDVGRLIRIDNPATGINWGWGIITAVASTTSVTVDVKRAFGSTSADTRWRLGVWSATTGYPSVGTFFEQRLFAANSTDQPETLWASQTADFENQSPDSPNTDATPLWNETVQDDDALDYTMSGDFVQAIRWLSGSSDVLAIGTMCGEWVPSSAGAVLTPADITIRQQTTHGSAAVWPVRIDHVVLFVQFAGRKLREFGFSVEVEGYRAFDMTRLADHITLGGISEMEYAEEPNSQVWAARNDGVLLSMTYRREEDVVAWGRHILGGSFGTGAAVVDSVTTICGGNGAGQVKDATARTEVWMIVKRTIGGATVRYVEFLEKDWTAGEDDQEDAYYVDSMVTYDGAATDTITGLGHLNGQVCKVLADGAVHPDRTPSGGSITLEGSYSGGQVGLGYRHRIETLKIEGGTSLGTAVGKPKVIAGITFVLLNSHTMSFGRDASNLQTVDFRTVADPVDARVPVFTGERFYEWDDGWRADPRILIQSDDPLPFTLLALAPELTVQEVI